jgi:uncharacterized protein with HEPN domain
MANETLQRAFVRSLEIIGEATKQIPEDFRRAHPGIDWRGMAGMRDRLIHGYFGVDVRCVVGRAPRGNQRRSTSSKTSYPCIGRVGTEM